MRAVLFPAAILAALSLSGCQTPPTPSAAPAPSQPPLVISQTRIATVARGVLAGLEGAAAAYVLSGNVSIADQTQIARAEVVAENAASNLGRVSPTDMPGVLKSMTDALTAFIETLPANRIPPSVTAGLTAFQAFVDVAAPVMMTPTVPGAQPGQTTASVVTLTK